MHFRLIFFFRFLQLQLPKKKATWPPRWWCCITYCCTKTYDYPTWSRFWCRVEKWSAILMISCRSCQSSSFYKPQKGIRIDLEVFIRSFYDCVRRISPIYVWSKILSCLTVWKSQKIASIAIICPLPKVRKKAAIFLVSILRQYLWNCDFQSFSFLLTKQVFYSDLQLIQIHLSVLWWNKLNDSSSRLIIEVQIKCAKVFLKA